MVWAKYPSFTPETIRALMVHAAQWTPAMRARFAAADGSTDYTNLVRCFGYGVPNLQDLLSSLDNSLTLVVESELQPFFKDADDHGRIKTREMRLHPLPWPIEELTALQNTDVTMRVTLSYFIEPSPGERGWDRSKRSFQKPGLRRTYETLETAGFGRPLLRRLEFRHSLRREERHRRQDYDSEGLTDIGPVTEEMSHRAVV